MTAVPGNVRRPATRPLQTVWPGWATWLAAGLVFGLAFTAVGWRLNLAPDVFTDEILYTRAGLRVAGEGALVWDNAEPLFVHPPLYFVLAGRFVRLTAAPSVKCGQAPRHARPV
ncbi:MAG: hypothetical protein ACE5G8_04260 [Anaerolineae bacterium]